MIKLDNVSVDYRNGKRVVHAVKNVSFEVEKGEIFGIVGTSGAGKSSLLRTLNLLEKNTSGTVVVDGKELNSLNAALLREFRFGVGMIFQSFNLAHSKTVYDNIAFVLKAAGKSKNQIRQRVEELLELVGLSDKIHEYPGRLSGGQKQRVGIARALANDAKILLSDEATSALDPETTHSILELLKRLNETIDITIVLITHELDVVKKICHRVAIMDQGEFLEIGDTYDVFARPQSEFAKRFISRQQNIELPDFVYKHSRNRIVSLRYYDQNAGEPLLHRFANQNNVLINILHGKIEFINHKALGILYVEFVGDRANVERLIQDLKQRDIDLEVLA